MPSIFSGLVGLSKLAVLSNGGLIWLKKSFSLTSPLSPPWSPTRAALNSDLTAFLARKEAWKFRIPRVSKWVSNENSVM